MFSNSMMTAVETAVLTIMVVLATPTLVRNFGVGSYGAFVFLNIFSIYGALYFFDLGMEASLTTYIARYDAVSDTKKMHLSLVVAVLYYGILGALVGLSLYAASDFISNRFIDVNDELNLVAVKHAITIISVNVFLQFLVLPFVAVLQGLQRYVVTKSVNSIATVIQYTVIMIVSHYYNSIDKAFLVITCMWVLRLIFYLGLFRFGFPQFRHMSFKVEFAQLKVLVGYSSVLFICRVLGLVNKNIAKLAIWLYLPVTNLTTYDVVAKPSMFVRMPEAVVGTSIIPEVARLSALGRRDEIAGLYVRLIRYTYLMLVPIVVAMAIFMSDLLRIWVGEQFVPYTSLVHILLLAFVIAPVPSLAFSAVVGLEKISDAIWISIVGTIINAVLSMTLLHYIGLSGLLLATVAMHAFMLWPYLKKLEQYVGLQPRAVMTSTGRIWLMAVPFAVLYLIVKYFLGDYTFLMFIVAAIVGLGHIASEYQWLLIERERVFFKTRVGLSSGESLASPVTEPFDPTNTLE
jgi:O-antigen/teichoic acid export membrane protein